MGAELAIIAKLQDEASSGIRALRGEIESLGESGGIAAKGFQSLQAIGAVALTALAGAAVATAAATGLFVKSAIQAGIEFESAFAGVVKTVDGVVDAGGALTAFGEELRDAFRQLALEIPVAVTELARIGELGGQLGVAGEDLIEFTRLIAQLGVTTNLSSEMAAMSFAQFGNIMQSTQDDLTRFGSAVVWLGNNFATTEADIVEFATRIAGAGAIAGMTEADLAGVAAAFSSVGVQAEAGGTAVQKVLLDINTSVVTGGSQLELYARTAGMTAEQFAAAWRSDPGEAFTRFVEGLGVAGDEAIMILDELGLADARLIRSFLSVAGAGDLLREAIEGSNQAFVENMALAREAALRFQTVESQMQLFRNVVNDVKIALYDALRPAIVVILAALTTFVASVAPQARQLFEALGAAVGQFVTALLQGEAPIGALIDAVFRLAEELGVPVERLAELRTQLDGFLAAVSAAVGPIVAAVTAFVSWKDVLIAVAIAIASVVIPALISIVSAVAPVMAVFAGLILAIAAVRNAFESNFLGIRDLALNLWSALQGVFEGIKALLQGDTTAAMEAFRSAWEMGWSAIVGFIQNAGAQIGQALAGLWQSIVAWFQGIDWGALGQLLVERFLAGMAVLGQARADLWEWILTSLTNFIQSVDWGQLGYTLIDLLIKGIVGAIGLIGAALAGLVTFIWNFITGTNWIELGINLVGAIVQGLYSFAQGAAAALADWRQVIFDWAGAEDWSGVGEHVAGMVGEALGAARDAIGAKLSEWQTAIVDWAGAEDWGGVAEHIAEMVGEKLGEAKDAVASKLSEWQTAIFDWAGAEDWQGVAEHIAESVGEKLGELGDTVANQLGEWQQAIFDWADAEDWSGVAEHIAEMVGEKLGETADAIAGQLSEWQQAIFDWADAEDWSGVAQKIAEMVGEKLGETADSVTSTLDSWEQAIFDWAGAADWPGVSETIASAIGDSLVDVSDKVTEKLSGWITAFTDWVETVDWYQVGYDIMFNITDAFLDFKETITEKISTWLEDTKSATEGYAWYEVGAYILLQIAESAAGTVADWVDTVGAWVSNIGSAVTQHLANLAQVGRDLVAGIAAGISAAGDLIAGAIAGVTAGAEPAARAASQSQSPSRLMMPVGYDLSAGIAVGIIQGAGTIIRAIQEVAGQMELEAIKAFSEAVKAIGEAIESAVRSYVLLSGFSGADTGGAAAGLASITLLMQGMVDAFAGANSHAAEALGLVGKFADAAGAIVGLIADSLLPLSILASIDTSFLRSGNLAEGLAAMRDFLIGLVGAFVEAAAELGVLGSLIESFTGAAESVVELVEGALSAAAMLAGFNFGAVVQGWHLQQQIITFRNIVQTMVREFADAALEFAFMSEAVQMFTEAAESVIGLVEDGLRASMMLSGFNFGAAVQGWHLQQQIIIFRNIVQTMVREFADAALEIGFMGEAVEAFTEAAEGVIGLVEEGLYAVMLLSGFNFGAAVQGWHLQQQIIIFRNIVRTMVREFAEAALEFGAMAESVSAFAEAAEGVIGLVEEGLAAAVMLSEIDFGSVVQGWHLAGQIEIFRNIIRTLIREFTEAAAEFGTMAESVEAFADAADAVLGLVIEGIEAIQALSETDFGALVQGWHLAGQIEIFRNIIRTLIREFSEAATEFGSMAESVEAFADAAGAVVDLVEPAIEAIGLLANYSADTGALSAALQQFIADLVALTLVLASGFQQVAAQIGESVESAAEFAERVNDLIGVVEPGIEALTVLATYVSATGAAAAVQAFAADLVTLVQALGSAFAAASAEMGTAAAQAADFAENAAAIVDVVEPGIEALTALADYVSASGVQERTQIFAADLVAVITALAQGLAASGLAANQAVTEAATLSDSLTEILDVVEPGIEALAALADYTSGADLQAKTQQFTSDLITVTHLLVAGLTQSALAAGSALSQATAMAQSIIQLFEVIKPALEALSDLAAYSAAADVQAKAAQFTVDLVAVANTVVTGLSTAATQLGQGAIAAAQAFAAAVTGIVQEVGEAISGLIQLSQLPTPNIQPNLDYLITSAQQIAAAAQQSGVVAQAGAQMAVFRDNVRQLVDEVIGALAELARLMAANAPGSVQQVLSQMLAAFQNQAGAFTGAGATIAGNVMAGWQAAPWGDSGQHAVDQIAAGVSAGSSMLTGAVNALIQAILSQARAFVSDFGEVGRSLIEAAAAGMAAATGAVMVAAVSAVNDAIGMAENAANTAGAVGDQFIDSVVAAIDGGRGAVMTAVVSLVNDAIDAGVGAARGADAVGDELVDAIESAIGGGVSTVKSTVERLVGETIDAGRNAARAATAIGQDLVNAANAAMASGRSSTESAGTAVGNALIDGMARAITSGKSRVVNAIVDTVQAAISAAKSALGISSPSRVAYEMIDNFMRTAAGRFADPRDLVAAVSRSMDATVVAATSRLARSRLSLTVPQSAAVTRTPLLPTVMPRPATAGPAATFAGGGVINVYGNIVLPNVSNPLSFLEELDALRGGGQ